MIVFIHCITILHLQPSCKKVVDKYVEFDAVVLLLDVLLLRIQSYRHLIFNYGLTHSVRVCMHEPGQSGLCGCFSFSLRSSGSSVSCWSYVKPISHCEVCSFVP